MGGVILHHPLAHALHVFFAILIWQGQSRLDGLTNFVHMIGIHHHRIKKLLGRPGKFTQDETAIAVIFAGDVLLATKFMPSLGESP